MSMSKQFGFLVAFVLMVSMTANASYYRRHSQRNNNKNRFVNDQLKVKIQASMNKFLCDYKSTKVMCTWKSIANKQVCDGTDDCIDKTDEKGCKPTPAPSTCPTCDMKCSDMEFTCKNKTCIPIENICNGNNDCGDLSDETGSICDKCTCADDQFQCTFTKKCIPRAQLCDGTADCMDMTDEPDNCLCNINAAAASTCGDINPDGDGLTIAMFNGADPTECIKACRRNPECKAVALETGATAACYLRTTEDVVGTSSNAPCAADLFPYHICT